MLHLKPAAPQAVSRRFHLSMARTGTGPHAPVAITRTLRGALATLRPRSSSISAVPDRCRMFRLPTSRPGRRAGRQVAFGGHKIPQGPASSQGRRGGHRAIQCARAGRRPCARSPRVVRSSPARHVVDRCDPPCFDGAGPPLTKCRTGARRSAPCCRSATLSGPPSATATMSYGEGGSRGGHVEGGERPATSRMLKPERRRARGRHGLTEGAASCAGASTRRACRARRFIPVVLRADEGDTRQQISLRLSPRGRLAGRADDLVRRCMLATVGPPGSDIHEVAAAREIVRSNQLGTSGVFRETCRRRLADHVPIRSPRITAISAGSRSPPPECQSPPVPHAPSSTGPPTQSGPAQIHLPDSRQAVLRDRPCATGRAC